MKVKKILAFLLTMALLVSSLTCVIHVSAEATDTLDVWDGTIADGYAGGSGTVAAPYLISTPEQLALLVTTSGADTSGKYYRLTADMYLNNTNNPDWKNDSPQNWCAPEKDNFFRGKFDGNGHIVKGLYYNGAKQDAALFAGVRGTVTIKNLTIADSELITTKNYAAAFAGQIYNSSAVTFENCYIYDTVSVASANYAAGFVAGGTCASISFRNCASFVTVAEVGRRGSFIGGLIYNNGTGDARKVTYNNCIGNIVYTNYAQYPTYTASYCAVDGTADSNSAANRTYPTVVSLENMKGTAAKTNMPTLSWNVWDTTDNYPVLNFNKDNFVYSFEDWTGGTNDKNATGVAVSTDFAKDGEKSLCYSPITGSMTTRRVMTLIESGRVAKVSQGTAYELSFWYKVNGVPTANDAKFVVYTTCESGPNSGVDYTTLQTLDKDIFFDTDTTGNGEDGWIKETVTFGANLKGVAYDRIAIGVLLTEGNAIGVNVYFDEITLKEAEFEAGGVWSGYVANSFAGGTGTHANPYLIENAEQFAKAISNTSEPGKYYKFTSDIYLNDVSAENWTENSPKSWYDRALYGESGSGVFFEGNVDGAGHTIYGAYYNGTRNAGIFPKVKNTTISNLRISDASLTTTSNSSMGALVGWGDGVVNIYNCGVEASVTVSADKGVSAFVGYAYPSVSINNCYSLATLAGTGHKGAFFGEVWNEEGINTREIYNSFAVGYPLIWDGTDEDPVAAVNCYATVADTEVITEGQITVLTQEAMQGAAALENMSDLDGFYATESYPAIKAIGMLLGDVDGDWNCNSTDLTALINILLGTSNVGLADINGDGSDDVRDLINLKKKCTGLPTNNYSYQLVWFDDFAGSTLNDANWTQTPCASYANDVFYTYDDSNIKLTSGDLNLTSFKNSYYDPEGDTPYKRAEYLVPGSVHTEGKMSYKYGYLEIRAKVPYKEGAWPAFWLRSSNAMGKNATAPYELEVDVFEVFGSRDTMRSNLHQHFSTKTEDTDENGNPIIEHTNIQTTTKAISQAEAHTFANSADLSDEYHIYGFEWTKNRMAIYVDRELQCEWFIDAESLASYGLNSDTAGFDTTLSVIFGNNLITSETEGFSVAQMIEGNEENLPMEFDIDWIRLYQKNDGLSELYIGY